MAFTSVFCEARFGTSQKVRFYWALFKPLFFGIFLFIDDLHGNTDEMEVVGFINAT